MKNIKFRTINASNFSYATPNQTAELSDSLQNPPQLCYILRRPFDDFLARTSPRLARGTRKPAGWGSSARMDTVRRQTHHAKPRTQHPSWALRNDCQSFHKETVWCICSQHGFLGKRRPNTTRYIGIVNKIHATDLKKLHLKAERLGFLTEMFSQSTAQCHNCEWTTISLCAGSNS